MRGCLFVVALAAALTLAAVWFAGPSVAGALVSAGLSAGGVATTTRTVAVDAEPPLELLLGRAHAVRIDATGATAVGIRAAHLVLTLRDVRLLDRTYDTIEATMTDVTVPSRGHDVLLSSIVVAGPADDATVTARLPAGEVAALIRDELTRVLPVAPTSVSLGAPDRATIVILGRTFEARLAVDSEGQVVLEPAATGLVRVVAFDPSGLPGLTVTKVQVLGDEVVIDGLANVPRLVP